MIFASGVWLQEASNQNTCSDCSLIVQRINYGTVFLPFTSMVVAENQWINVFQIDMLRHLSPLGAWPHCVETVGDGRLQAQGDGASFDV